MNDSMARRVNFILEGQIDKQLFLRMSNTLLNSLKVGGGSLWWLERIDRTRTHLSSHILSRPRRTPAPGTNIMTDNKITVVILNDGETYAGDATVAKVNPEIMERVEAGEDQLLQPYAEHGIDAVCAAEAIMEISAELQEALGGIDLNCEGCFPGTAREHSCGMPLESTLQGRSHDYEQLKKFRAAVIKTMRANQDAFFPAGVTPVWGKDLDGGS